MNQLKKRKQQKIITDLELELNSQKKDYQTFLIKIKKQINILDKHLQGGIQGLLGKSYWSENDITKLYNNLDIKPLLTTEMMYFMNAINLYFYYYKMPTIVSLILFKDSREDFINMVKLMINKGHYAPMGLYVLGRVIMNDNTFSSNISDIQPKFIVNFFSGLPQSNFNILSEIGLRLTTKMLIDKFFKNKVKMDGGYKIKYCKAKTKLGKICRNKVNKKNKYCYLHQ